MYSRLRSIKKKFHPKTLLRGASSCGDICLFAVNDLTVIYSCPAGWTPILLCPRWQKTQPQHLWLKTSRVSHRLSQDRAQRGGGHTRMEIKAGVVDGFHWDAGAALADVCRSGTKGVSSRPVCAAGKGGATCYLRRESDFGGCTYDEHSI